MMLLRNISPKRGLSNGTRLIIKRLNSFTVECEVCVLITEDYHWEMQRAYNIFTQNNIRVPK